MSERLKTRLARNLALAVLAGLCACSDEGVAPSADEAGTEVGAPDGSTEAGPDVGSADISGDAPADLGPADSIGDPEDVADARDDPIDEPDTPGSDLGTDESTDADGGPDPSCVDTPIDPTLPSPSASTDPCEAPDLWPLSLASERYPFVVHHRPGEESIACQVRQLLETSWRVEVDELGFRPPLPDGGACGPDERFDVYIWDGIVETYVYAFDENPATEWDDRLAYMVIDPFGPYGGPVLDATVAHEFNHACQAADDWWESPVVFEMTATFMEDVVFDEDNSFMELLVDFQSQPDWSLDRDDGWDTWYMYAAALYLHFLREHHFGGDPDFTADMWLRSRNPPGAELDQTLNEPDFEDALEAILQESAGVSFLDTVVTFARWRWYTGSRDDGRHFEEGALFPEDAAVALAARVPADAGSLDVRPRPMVLGSAYVEVFSDEVEAFTLSLDADDRVDWVVQAVPGLEAGLDGEIVDLSSGSATVGLADDGTRTLIVTALPSGEHDPDERSDQRYRLSLVVDALVE